MSWGMLAAEPEASQPAPPPQLSAFERSLIGTWYFGGDAAQPCYITSAGEMIFAITQDKRAAHIITQPGNSFTADEYEPGLHASVSPDRIAWSNDTWWSRQPTSGASAPAVAEGGGAAHWYRVTVTEGQWIENYTGTSPLDPDQFGVAVVAEGAPLVLENLREFGSVDGQPPAWRAQDDVRKLMIVPRTILHFAELTKDPLAK